jgi:hypothetical protein
VIGAAACSDAGHASCAFGVSALLDKTAELLSALFQTSALSCPNTLLYSFQETVLRTDEDEEEDFLPLDTSVGSNLRLMLFESCSKIILSTNFFFKTSFRQRWSFDTAAFLNSSKAESRPFLKVASSLQQEARCAISSN